jgi:Uma2 family endonuclease
MESRPMTTLRTNSPSPRRWTYTDYCRLPADGKRHELIDGRHFVSPAPDLDHQGITLALASVLRAQIQSAGLGMVFIAPADVHLDPGAVLQPDVFALRATREEVAGRRKVDRAPELVVEVLSASTQKRDRGIKLRRYERAGVAECWLVDPKARAVEPFVRVEGELRTLGVNSLRIASVAFPGVAIDLLELW